MKKKIVLFITGLFIIGLCQAMFNLMLKNKINILYFMPIWTLFYVVYFYIIFKLLLKK